MRVRATGLWKQLRRNGWAVLDNALDSNTMHCILKEIKAMEDILIPNSTKLVLHQQVHVLPKHGILEQELFDPKVQTLAPTLCRLYNDPSFLMESLMEDSGAELELWKQDIKVQYNTGNGGCFPMHNDSDASIDQRILTAIFYLNPSWHPSHGGLLRLYPFPYSHIDISPIFNRMVIFSSTQITHRVLPAVSPRYAFTVWISGAVHSTLSYTNLQALQPHVRNLLAKVVYAREWADSLEESHPPSPQRDQMLQKHWDDVGRIMQIHYDLIPQVSQYPLPHHTDQEIVKWF